MKLIEKEYDPMRSSEVDDIHFYSLILIFRVCDQCICILTQHL